jgi:hypothetical protein
MAFNPLDNKLQSSQIRDPMSGSFIEVDTFSSPTGEQIAAAKDGSGRQFKWDRSKGYVPIEKAQPSDLPNPKIASQATPPPRAASQVIPDQIPVGAPTASKQTGRFAGSKLAGMAGKTAVGGLIGLGIISDVGSLMDSNQERKEQARKMAKNLVDQGYTDYDAVMALAQSNPSLESAIGDIGVSDYAKTAAGVGMNIGEIIGLATLGAKAGGAVGAAGGPVGIGAGALLGGGAAVLGSIAQVDLQRKKSKRNEAFREQFTNELIQRGLA